jgi:putative phosphoribosyl transferase
LLTSDEAADRERVFDIALLAERLTAAIDWLGEQPQARRLPIGLFGASTGAAAALWAAAEPESVVRAVVSRGGRPDLAGHRLEAVQAPTLLIVGGADPAVLELNEKAGRLLGCERRLVVVPGATHLFEQPGALETVARLASDWFVGHLASAAPVAR